MKNENIASQEELPLSEHNVVRAANPQSLDTRLVLGVIAAVAILLWGAWITKSIVDTGGGNNIKSVELQPLIQEYVQAQSRSESDVASITAETENFMVVLQEELKKAGENGDTIVVAEAVLSKNVPDITPDIRTAVYARVALPKTVSIDQRATGNPADSLPSMLGEGDER
tara:strand:- start:49730 stop:50239 length:510 start_codon:yes stop_codon:yes gene_type:complete